MSLENYKYDNPRDKLIYETDYSSFELLDFSIETFKHFDKRGIKLKSHQIGLKINFSSFQSLVKNEFVEDLESILSVLDINSRINNIDKEVFVTDIIKGRWQIPIEIDSRFFLNFYENSLQYSKLFEEFNNSYYHGEDGLGNGHFKERIEQQLYFYTQSYLKLHLTKRIEIIDTIQTIVDNDGSPILYMDNWCSIRVCMSNMRNVHFNEFSKFNNSSIKTFTNIKSIGALSVANNISLENLGSIQTIYGYCSLSNSTINSTGSLKRVYDNLTIHNCENIRNLGVLEKVNGNLNLRGSSINEIKNIHIKGNLIFNKKFKENHIVENCIIGGKVKFFSSL
tara:strand:- start:2145 stop:3158 length:1014 start_codon:yes stop_codon:yes gene_type:complete